MSCWVVLFNCVVMTVMNWSRQEHSWCWDASSYLPNLCSYIQLYRLLSCILLLSNFTYLCFTCCNNFCGVIIMYFVYVHITLAWCRKSAIFLLLTIAVILKYHPVAACVLFVALIIIGPVSSSLCYMLYTLYTCLYYACIRAPIEEGKPVIAQSWR